MPTILQFFRDPVSARAPLRRTPWVYLHQMTTSFFRFVRQHVDESTPTRVMNTLGKHPACQTLDIQILHSNQPKPVDQTTGNLVVKIHSLITDVGMDFLENPNGFPPTVTLRTRTTRNLSLSPANFGLCILGESEVFDLGTVCHSCKMGKAYVNPSDLFRLSQLPVFRNFHGEAGIPFACFTLDRDILDFTLYRAVQFNSDVPSPLKVKLSIIQQFYAITIGWKSNTSKTSEGLEAGKSRFIPPFDSGEKITESFVQPSKNILAAGEVGKP